MIAAAQLVPLPPQTSTVALLCAMASPVSSGLRVTNASNNFVLPGDHLATLIDPPTNAPRPVIRLGTGVTQKGPNLHASRSGKPRHDARRNKLWIESNHKRYVPALEDGILGIVQERHADDYRLDINGTDTATLNALAFEGATKKNKPNLEVGALVYCRVVRASKNMEAEVSCIEIGSNKSWVGGETLYGALTEGNVVHVSLACARALLRGTGSALATLGESVAFESAVGVNGRIWLKAGSVQQTMLLSLAVQKADVMEAEEWRKFVKGIFSRR